MNYVGRAAFSGALWNISGAAANKVITAVGQIALAWFLVPADFGVASLAFAVASIAALIGSSGLRQILVQRSDEPISELGQGLWLALALDTTAAVLVGLSAPVASRVFGDARVGTALLIVAFSYPIQALSTVPIAILCRNLRFREMALINAAQGFVRTAGSVALALGGVGPFSLVIPVPISYCVVAIAARTAAGTVPWPRPKWFVWRRWLPSSVWASGLSFLNGLQAYGPALVLGVVAGSAEVGVFSWGYALAGQALFLAATSLKSVLFPSFATLTPAQRTSAFRAGAPMMWLVGAPLCVLQALLAEPVITAVFGARWSAAVPVVVWTSLGLLMLPLDVLGESVLSAEGRFRSLVLIRIIQLALIVCAAALGAHLDGAGNVAGLMSVVLFASHCVVAVVAWKCLKQPLGTLAGVLAEVLAALVVASVLGCGSRIALGTAARSINVIGTGLVFCLAYVAALRFAGRSTIRELRRLMRARHECT